MPVNRSQPGDKTPSPGKIPATPRAPGLPGTPVATTAAGPTKPNAPGKTSAPGKTQAAAGTSATAKTGTDPKTPATNSAATGNGSGRASRSSARPAGGASGHSGGSGRPSGNRASAARQARSAAVKSSGNRPRSKSLVVKKRTPWGLIITCVLVVVFAAAVIGYAVSRPKKVSAADAPYVRDEIAAAKAIPGVIFKKEINHTHVTSPVKYNTSPPIGGNHSAVWADCTGTVYPEQIANENAVHPLEHGAVWITYRPDLDATSVATLAKLVTGQNYTLMSPYAGLKTPISLQAWNYQLFVTSPTDPRITAFIKALRNNPGTTPEYPGQCSDPAFKKTPSTPANPTWSQ